MKKRMHTVLCLIAALLVVGLLAGCEDAIERSLGKQASAAVEREFGLNRDPVLADWASTLGHRLEGQSRRQTIPYNFRVVNTDMVNAFAAPWGYVYLTQGMLDFAESEDEIAFIVGHEVAHVANRDSIKGYQKSILFNIGLAVLGRKNESLSRLGGLGAGLLMLSYSRDDERDADGNGSTFAYAAGYDPAAGNTFFERLMKEIEKDRPSSMEYLFLTHPPTTSRLAAHKQRPEMNLDDPVVASRIGRSYARRHAYATATSYYRRALKQKPEAVETRLALAEALAAQGLHEQAEREYQAVLKHDGDNRYATAALAALPAPAAAPPPTASERQQAAEVLALAGSVQTQSAAAVLASRGFMKTAAGGSVSQVVRGSIGDMQQIADLDRQLDRIAQEAFLRASGAVSDANEAAYTLEALHEEMVAVSELLQGTAGGLQTAVTQVAAGEAQAGDLAIYRRALLEIRAAQQQLQAALPVAQDAQQAIALATRSARETTGQLRTMVTARSPGRYLYPVRVHATQTQERADAAVQAVGKVKKTVVTAEARALLAKLNLAALGLSPEARAAYDGMTAYYCHVSPRQVEALRQQGLGFGDAAFVLIASRTREIKPENYLKMVQDNRLIDGLRGEGFNLRGPVALLRFLSNTIDRERAEGQG